MTGDLDSAIRELDRRFLLDHPSEAARLVEELDEESVTDELADQSARVLVPVFRRLQPAVAGRLIERLPEALTQSLMSELLPREAVQILGTLDQESEQAILRQLPISIQEELKDLMSYPQDTAGFLMDTRIDMFHEAITVGRALDLLRRHRTRTARSLFLVGEDNRLVGKVSIQEVAVADPGERLKDIAQPLTASVSALTPKDEVVQLVESHQLADLPVVDVDGRLLGVIYNATLMHAIQEDVSADIQMMSGASPDEKALSSPWFAVRKRLPWLQVNLLTAFLAAAVVGLFESTIAKYTALAVLLPVVAGQSGNAGAQALAVTMRGLFLKEITPRQWLGVTLKEASVGLVNGMAIAVTCGLGVYVWSRSLGLVIVIMSSMVLAMIAAGLAGALVPIALRRLGQDPAQSSSIILTTVTDIAGFFSFLGIATVLSNMLG